MDAKPHPEYTLPGVVHYLQLEYTRNERDRILWNSEREEMKLALAKLTGENMDLKKLVRSLEEEILQLRRSPSTQKAAPGHNNKLEQLGSRADDAHSNGVDSIATQVAELDITPLKKAREHLKTRMDEVMYLLRENDPGMVDTLELKKQRGLLALAERKNKRSLGAKETTRPYDYASFATPDPDSPNEFFKKPVPPDVIQPGDATTEDNHDDFAEESDADTVMGEGEDLTHLKDDSPTLAETVISDPLFTLSPHPSNIIGVSVKGDQLLSASKEGDIMTWRLPELVADEDNAKPIGSYFDIDPPIFMKWVTQRTFLTANHSSFKFWDVSITDGPKIQLQLENIKDIQCSSSFVVIHTPQGLNLLKLGQNGLPAPHELPQLLKGTADTQSFTISNDDIFAYTGRGALEKLSSTSKNTLNNYVIDSLSDATVSNMCIHNNIIALLSSSGVILYDIDSNLSTPIGTVSSTYSSFALTDKLCILFASNGNVEVFSRLDNSLRAKLNHYLQPDLDSSNTLFKSVGTVYQGKYVITGGEDMQVRCWRLN